MKRNRARTEAGACGRRRKGLGPCLLTGKRAFEGPIPLPDGRALPTLLDAGEYINSLSKAEQRTTEWQNATAILLLVVEGKTGPTKLARIGIMRALNRNHVPEFISQAKTPHQGRRKLKGNE